MLSCSRPHPPLNRHHSFSANRPSSGGIFFIMKSCHVASHTTQSCYPDNNGRPSDSINQPPATLKPISWFIGYTQVKCKNISFRRTKEWMVRYSEHLPLIKVQTQWNNEEDGRNMEKHFNWMHKFLIRLQLNDNEWKEIFSFQINIHILCHSQLITNTFEWSWGGDRNAVSEGSEDVPAIPGKQQYSLLTWHPFPTQTQQHSTFYTVAN